MSMSDADTECQYRMTYVNTGCRYRMLVYTSIAQRPILVTVNTAQVNRKSTAHLERRSSKFSNLIFFANFDKWCNKRKYRLIKKLWLCDYAFDDLLRNIGTSVLKQQFKFVWHHCTSLKSSIRVCESRLYAIEIRIRSAVQTNYKFQMCAAGFRLWHVRHRCIRLRHVCRRLVRLRHFRR